MLLDQIKGFFLNPDGQPNWIKILIAGAMVTIPLILRAQKKARNRRRTAKARRTRLKNQRKGTRKRR